MPIFELTHNAILIIEVGGNALSITMNDTHVLSLCKIYFFFATGFRIHYLNVQLYELI